MVQDDSLVVISINACHQELKMGEVSWCRISIIILNVIIISTCYYSFWKAQQMVLIPTMYSILAVYVHAPNLYNYPKQRKLQIVLLRRKYVGQMTHMYTHTKKKKN